MFSESHHQCFIAGIKNDRISCSTACGTASIRLHIREADMRRPLRISARGDGAQKNYKISACGDVKFWLHFLKRNCRFWIVFPRGGNVNLHVHIPLAGTMHRNNYKISACGDVKFWLHFRKRNCRFWIVYMHIKKYISPRGNTIQNRQFRLRKCNQDFTSRKRRFCNYFCAPSSRADGAHENLHFPSREYDPESTVPLAGMHSNFTSPQAEIL